MDPESDREIADHVVRMHRYRKPGEMDGERKCFIFCCQYVMYFLLKAIF